MSRTIKAVTFDLWDTLVHDDSDEPKRKGASGQKQFAFGYRPPTRTLVPSEEGRYCEYHHTDLIQSPKSGKWGHVVDGQACFGLAAEPEDADDIPY